MIEVNSFSTFFLSKKSIAFLISAHFSYFSCFSDAIYDITIDKQDFHHTLEESLIAYEKEEKYEKCAEIKKAMDWLEKKKAEKAVSSIVESLAT